MLQLSASFPPPLETEHVLQLPFVVRGFNLVITKVEGNSCCLSAVKHMKEPAFPKCHLWFVMPKAWLQYRGRTKQYCCLCSLAVCIFSRTKISSYTKRLNKRYSIVIIGYASTYIQTLVDKMDIITTWLIIGEFGTKIRGKVLADLSQRLKLCLLYACYYFSMLSIAKHLHRLLTPLGKVGQVLIRSVNVSELFKNAYSIMNHGCRNHMCSKCAVIES